MAIDFLKKVTVIIPKENSFRLLQSINNLGMMEIIDTRDSLDEDVPFDRYETSTEEADSYLHKIDFILNFMNIFYPRKESFLKSLTPLPIVTSTEEIDKVLNKYEFEKHYLFVSELDDVYRSSERLINEIAAEIDELKPISDISFDLKDLFSTTHIDIIMGYMPKKHLIDLKHVADTLERFAWEEFEPEVTVGNDKDHISKDKKHNDGRTRMLFAFLKRDAEVVRKALSDIGFEEIQPPKNVENIVDRIQELGLSLEKQRKQITDVAEKIKPLIDGQHEEEGRRHLQILKAYWTNIRNRQIAANKALHGKWLYILAGYVRVKDLDTFIAMIEKEFPESVLKLEDPSLEEDVPVSISLPYLLRPIKLLTEMFGLPYYREFDPTPFMQLNFYIFFGICFSDVGYGTMLTLMGTCLAYKTKPYSGVNNLVRILLYSGISSIIFGALTGSWFGDLHKPEYLGHGNILHLLQQRFIVLNPMDKTILALIIALGLGVLNQFLGITLKMYGALRKKDFLGAFSDGICWVATLSGLLMMTGKVFGEIPHKIFYTGLWLFVGGAIGLIFTQGRFIKNPLGKIAGGVVSLYGIVGSYGITAFIGDTLSYCRLLALGLTTSIIAVAFNLMAGIVREVPYVGMVLFIVVLFIGHMFNFLISALGAFVHSMRLIFVEFFGRFYEGGTRPFQPLGFDSAMCVVKKEND